MNTLNKNLQFTFGEKTTTIENKNFEYICVNGNLLGMVDNCQPIPKEETLERISKVENINELIGTIRLIVGNNWFFAKYKNNVYLLSSASAPPYFFYKKSNLLNFSSIESHICSLAAQDGQKINPYELYDLLNLIRKELTTYGSLFQNVTKIPCGHVLKIDKNFNFSYQTYFTDSNPHPPKHTYKNFKKILESIAQLYANSGYKLYVYLGGIDSLVTYLSVNNFSDSVTPISYCQEGGGFFDGGNVRETCVVYKDAFDIDVNLIYADRYSKELRKIRDDICALSSSNNCRWDSYMYYSVMNKFKNCKNCYFLTGIPFDSLYGVAFTKNLFGDFSGMIGRYFYTKMYQNNIDGFFNKCLRNFFRSKSDFNSKKEYIYALVDPYQYMSHSLPLIKDKKIFENDGFFKNYVDYKERTFITSAIKKPQCIDSFSGYELNKMFRILKHFQSALLHYRNIVCLDYYANMNTVFFPGEGPMLNFLMDIQLDMNDIFVGKQFLHKYVREVTGNSYSKAFIRSHSSEKLDLVKKIIPSLNKYDFSYIKDEIKGDRIKLRSFDGCKDKFMISEVFRNDFFDKVDLKNPTLLKYTDNPFLIKYINEYYNDAFKGLLNMDEVNDIYNLEIFLKNL